MVRLLRRLLRLGVLAGIGVGILKLVRGRKAPDPWADSWVSTGVPGATRPSAAPVAAPKPPAPTTASAAVAPPPPASPKPPAPTPGTAPTPPATPAPPAPTAGGDGDSGEAHRAGGKAAPGRAAKPTRTGPARKSPTGKAAEPPGERLWVPANDGVCPQTHPIKAKLSSKIFHTPGGRNYKSTKADRCYPDEASAQADGLRPSLR